MRYVCGPSLARADSPRFHVNDQFYMWKSSRAAATDNNLTYQSSKEKDAVAEVCAMSYYYVPQPPARVRYLPPRMEYYYQPPPEKYEYQPPAQEVLVDQPPEVYYLPPPEVYYLQSPPERYLYQPPPQEYYYQPPPQAYYYQPPAQRVPYPPVASPQTPEIPLSGTDLPCGAAYQPATYPPMYYVGACAFPPNPRFPPVPCEVRAVPTPFRYYSPRELPIKR